MYIAILYLSRELTKVGTVIDCLDITHITKTITKRANSEAVKTLWRTKQLIAKPITHITMPAKHSITQGEKRWIYL